MEWCRVEKRHVVSVFDEIAPSYDRGRGAWYSAIARVVHGLKGLVLDVGAGTGEIACRLASQGVEAVAVDSSLSMLKILRRKAARRGLSHLVHPVAAHLPLLPVRRGSFDAVLALAVLHHVYGRERRVHALREMARALKPKGLCVVTAWYRYHPRNFLRSLASFLHGASWGDVLVPWRRRGLTLYRYYHMYSRRELSEDLRRAGLAGTVLLWDPRPCFFKRNVLAVAAVAESTD